MNQEKKINKVYLPHFDNGMSYSDHSNVTYGKVYASIQDAINFILEGHKGYYGETEPYAIAKENHFDKEWHKNYAYLGEKRLSFLFQPDVTKLPEYDFRTELNHDEIDEFAYIEILEVE